MNLADLPLFAARAIRPAAPGEKPPRYYQAEAHKAVVEGHEAGRLKQLVVLPTGTGKTVLFTQVAKHELERSSDTRVLVLVHRNELLLQAKTELEQTLRVPVGIEQAMNRSYRERVVVASVQTLYQDRRLERFKYWGNPTLLIADEVHHATATSWKKILSAWPEARALGVTATPDRQDGKGLGEVFDHLAYDMQLDRAIDEGWLVPLMRHPVHLAEIDISGVENQTGDLKIGQLDTAMLRAVEGVCTETMRLYPEGRGPVFFPGKSSANMAAARFNALKPDCARVLTDDTEPEERAAIMRDVKQGRVQWLCNVGICTEGFDWPQVSVVVMARPTKSRSLCAQMVGRGTRTLPGTLDGMLGRWEANDRLSAIAASDKPHCVILDFVGNSGKHKLVTLTDLLGKGYSPAEHEAAQKLAAKAGTLKPPKEWLDQARRELQEMAARMRSKVRSKDGGRSRMDFGATPSGSTPLADGIFVPARGDMVAALERAGWPNAAKLSDQQARAASREIKRRMAAKLATLKQVKCIQRSIPSWTDTEVPFAVAGALMNALTANKWKLSPQQVSEVLTRMKYTPKPPKEPAWAKKS